MKSPLNMPKIARVLGAHRRGKVRAVSGPFGAAELSANVTGRFRTPEGGGRPTDPRWTERRLVGLSKASLRKLKKLSTGMQRKQRVPMSPMQVAALLLEKALAECADGEDLARKGSAADARQGRRQALGLRG